jgi:discoidin domain receptor family protein 2
MEVWRVQGLLVLFLSYTTGRSVDASMGCSAPLGVESGRIQDSQLTASSAYDMNSVGPAWARLNSNSAGGAWCPRSFISQESGLQEFLEVDLLQEHTITGIVTQGRFANGQGQEYAEFFKLQYWREGMEAFAQYQNKQGLSIFPGNKDTFTEVETRVEPPIRAIRIRIIPFSYHPRTVCMRVELKGCLEILSGNAKSLDLFHLQKMHLHFCLLVNI